MAKTRRRSALIVLKSVGGQNPNAKSQHKIPRPLRSTLSRSLRVGPAGDFLLQETRNQPIGQRTFYLMPWRQLAAKIGLGHHRIIHQFLGGALCNDIARCQEIPPIRHTQALLGVLFNQQNAHTGFTNLL